MITQNGKLSPHFFFLDLFLFIINIIFKIIFAIIICLPVCVLCVCVCGQVLHPRSFRFERARYLPEFTPSFHRLIIFEPPTFIFIGKINERSK